jgi:hypothetical protein
MERNILGGEKWGRNELKICFQQFLPRPVWTQVEKVTFCKVSLDTRFARLDRCLVVNLLPNLSAGHLDTSEDTILLHDPFGLRIGPSGHTTQKLNSKCFLSVFLPHFT